MDLDHNKLRRGHRLADLARQPDRHFTEPLHVPVNLPGQHMGEHVVDFPHVSHGVFPAYRFRTGWTAKRDHSANTIYHSPKAPPSSVRSTGLATVYLSEVFCNNARLSTDPKFL